MNRDVKKIISEMTLEEKASLCSGLDFWHLKGVERLGIPSVMVSDGPHGLRKQDDKGDHLGMNDSIKAVCFPTACATACSFDRELLTKLGEALGEECQAEGVSVLLGPAVNIKRSPLCGRNFEYFSEDPYLSTEMAASHIKGVQSKNVGTSIKHFAANNQEYRRMSCSSELDERTFREIYLASFEGAVKNAKPWTVMCSYNKINGTYSATNHYLLTDILRDEWGFDGYVMTDWGAVNHRVDDLKAGLDLEMPGSGGNTDREIVAAVQDGSLDEAVLDTAVERILKKVFAFEENRIPAEFDRDRHHQLAEKLAEECMVLLKNDGVLPLSKDGDIAFIGKFASAPRFQGGGSSHINCHKVTSAWDSVRDWGNISYAQGYDIKEDIVDEELLAEAVEAAKKASAAVIFAGLPDSFESEGYDRTHIDLPNCQNRLIEEVSRVQPNTIVVLHNGSPVAMPWVDNVKAILEVYLGGQGVGAATVKVLFGDANPCGKLAETFPKQLEDNPSYLNFPGDGCRVEYREGVFVGYRYYDTKKMDVLFPFGHGLSYTTFAYSNLKLSTHEMKDTERLTVSVDVTNTGSVAGKEIVELYVRDKTNAISRPVKELKGFDKVELQPGETKTVTMELDKRAFAWYHTGLSDWYCATGDYDILIGKSSREIVLSDTVHVTTDVMLPWSVDETTTCGQLKDDPRTRGLLLEMRKKIPLFNQPEPEQSDAAAEAISKDMMESMMRDTPLKSLKSFAGMSTAEMDAVIQQLNELLK